jgi:3-hydroxybutyryl-CoA dehydrogenase
MAQPLAGTVGVIGGGTMGSGIVHVLLASGYQAALVEMDEEALAQARRRIEDSLGKAARRGKLQDEPGQVLARLTATTELADLADAAVVIESVPENMELKKSLLRRVEAHLDDTAVVASNTSSLSIAELADGLRRPERVLGLHFFNPVPVSALVEIAVTDQTGRPARETARSLAENLGKEIVEVRDSPGFATSRLGVLLGLEAVRMVESGVADPADIDRAMELGYRHPMGPLRLTDLVGLDVRLGIADYLHATLGPRFEPPALMRRMVQEGKLGKKSGQGFYPWP